MDGRSFGEVVGDVFASDMQREAQRIEGERRAREALRRQADALKSVQSMSASDLLSGVFSEGDKVAKELKGPPKEANRAAPVKPVVSSFPAPPSHR